MASRNGLNPKIRGPKGVGYGRALPSAFGFGNGIVGNNNINSISFPTIIGTPFLFQFTIEFWIKLDTSIPTFEGYLEIADDNGQYGRIQGQPSGHSDLAFKFENTGLQGGNEGGNLTKGEKNHVVFTIDFINGSFSQTINGETGAKIGGTCSISTDYIPGNISIFNIVGCPQKLGLSSSKYIDEFRMYNGVMTDLEIKTNYNNGYGSNPSITEKLVTWLSFEKFENLDFSLQQDGSDIRVGIKDQSGRNNHAQSNGFDTNPMSTAYPLNPF